MPIQSASAPATGLRELLAARGLLRRLVERDLAVRYRETSLGFLWALARPLALMAIYHAVFTWILPAPIREPRIPFALHILAGVLPWTFLAAAAGEALPCILANASLVKKVRLPLEVFPLAAVCAQAFHFGLAMLAMTAGAILLGLAPGPVLLLVPIVAAVQFLFVLAVALLLSSLEVFYRDVASVWEVGATGWFFATPIVYPLHAASEFLAGAGHDWARTLYLANPMTPFVAAYRRLVLYSALESPVLEISDRELAVSFLGAVATTAVLLLFAHRVFARLSRRFADVV